MLLWLCTAKLIDGVLRHKPCVARRNTTVASERDKKKCVTTATTTTTISAVNTVVTKDGFAKARGDHLLGAGDDLRLVVHVRRAKLQQHVQERNRAQKVVRQRLAMIDGEHNSGGRKAAAAHNRHRRVRFFFLISIRSWIVRGFAASWSLTQILVHLGNTGGEDDNQLYGWHVEACNVHK